MHVRVEQHHARACVPRSHLAQRRACGKHAEVSGAAQVERDRGLRRAAEKQPVYKRHERRTLPAGRAIRAPEVEDDGRLRALADRVGIADLDRTLTVAVVKERQTVARDVIERLALRERGRGASEGATQQSVERGDVGGSRFVRR